MYISKQWFLKSLLNFNYFGGYKIMDLKFDVQAKKKLRVIVDTDADCEADDPYAIAHALMSPKLNIRAIFAEQFGDENSTQRSFDEIQRILSAMSLYVPAYMGAKGSLEMTKDQPISPASSFLIDEAMRDDPNELFVLCLGAITNVAAAIKACPDIITRMTVVWIAGHAHTESGKAPFKEFNSGNDIPAANVVFNSGVKLWQIPSNVYGSIRIGLAELQRRVYPCGEIGKHLFEKMVNYNCSKYADWTAGESWSLGDSPAVGVALDEHCGRYEYREAPFFNDDTSYTYIKDRPLIRVYQSIDSRYIIEDFIAKLEILYGNL